MCTARSRFCQHHLLWLLWPWNIYPSPPIRCALIMSIFWSWFGGIFSPVLKKWYNNWHTLVLSSPCDCLIFWNTILSLTHLAFTYSSSSRRSSTTFSNPVTCPSVRLHLARRLLFSSDKASICSNWHCGVYDSQFAMYSFTELVCTICRWGNVFTDVSSISCHSVFLANG